MNWQLGLAWLARELGSDLQRAARRAGGGHALWSAGPTGWERLGPRYARDPGRLGDAYRSFDEARMTAGLDEVGAVHVPNDHRTYPSALSEIPDPPFGLFVVGRVDGGWLGAGPVVAIVGSRRPTSAGRIFARRLASAIAARGGVVVSGLAHGIDAAAHEGALEACGRTVAVVGCGVDIVYPKRHRELRGRIIDSGAVISEYWLGTEPAPWRFPARNRIVAGLADAVVVVEAAERSGALITADFSLELGRPVLAVPGSPGAVMSAGCNGLIRAGAAMCEGIDDVVDEISHDGWRAPAAATITAPLSSGDQQVRELLLREPLDFDSICERLRRPASEVGAMLGRLELTGQITRGDGHRYWAATPLARRAC